MLSLFFLSATFRLSPTIRILRRKIWRQKYKKIEKKWLACFTPCCFLPPLLSSSLFYSLFYSLLFSFSLVVFFLPCCPPCCFLPSLLSSLLFSSSLVVFVLVFFFTLLGGAILCRGLRCRDLVVRCTGGRHKLRRQYHQHRCDDGARAVDHHQGKAVMIATVLDIECLLARNPIISNHGAEPSALLFSISQKNRKGNDGEGKRSAARGSTNPPKRLARFLFDEGDDRQEHRGKRGRHGKNSKNNGCNVLAVRPREPNAGVIRI